MSNRSHEKVIIIGAGAAGLTAGIYTARANMSPVILAGLQPGGQMTITTDVENYPGFAEGIQGPLLMQEMQRQFHSIDTSTRSSRTTFTLPISRSWVGAMNFGVTKESNVTCTLQS